MHTPVLLKKRQPGGGPDENQITKDATAALHVRGCECSNDILRWPGIFPSLSCYHRSPVCLLGIAIPRFLAKGETVAFRLNHTPIPSLLLSFLFFPLRRMRLL